MKKLQFRRQRVSDAKRFYEILSNPKFTYFIASPASIEVEREFLKLNAEKRRKNVEHNFAITYDGRVIGACGIKIKVPNTHVGEIGYFIDEEYWGRGIAVKAVKYLEKYVSKEHDILRFEIVPAKKESCQCTRRKKVRLQI